MNAPTITQNPTGHGRACDNAGTIYTHTISTPNPESQIPLVPKFEMMPHALIARPQWVVWIFADNPGKSKKAKIPLTPVQGCAASCTNSAHWGSFAQARAFYEHHKGTIKTVATKEEKRTGVVAGIGYCLAADDPFAGIDLDNCIFPDGTLEPWAHKIATTLQSYTEISPSGTGIRIFVRGMLPPGSRRRGNIEMYDQGRFLTLTGHVLEGFPATIEARQAELEQVHSMLLVQPVPPPPLAINSTQSAPAYLDADDLLRRARNAKNGTLFSSLYDAGNISAYSSASEADAALCSLLAYWLDKDHAAIDTAFRRSALYQAEGRAKKWDTVCVQGKTYGQATIERAAAVVENTFQQGKPTSATDPMPAPVPFDDITLPTIDIAALPPVLADFCGAVSVALQVPVELPIAATLAAISVAVQGRFVVKVRQGYREPLCTYWLTPLPPSDLKTPTLKLCKAPLDSWEAQQAEIWQPKIKAAQSERRTMEKVIEEKRKAAAKKNNTADIANAAREIAEMEAALPDVPAMPRLLVDDITPEGLAALMEQQGGRMGIMEAEGGLFGILAGRYSSGAPNLDLVLKAFSVEAVRVDRRHGASLFIPAPHLTLFLSPQPHVLTQREAGAAFRGRGFDARFAYIIPKSRAGFRDMEPPPVPEHMRRHYAHMLHGLLDTPFALSESGEPTAHILTLSTGAYAVWLDFAKAVEKSLAPNGELADMPDWGGKLKGLVARLAGLLHCAAHVQPHSCDIEAATMQNACYLGGILAEHARAAYGLMGQSEGMECAKRILQWICSTRQQTFKARDCFNAIRGSFPAMEQVTAGLAVLVERFYIAELSPPPRMGAGRPASPVYKVNPATFTGHDGGRA